MQNSLLKPSVTHSMGLPGVLTQKIKGVVEMAKGETLKNRHVFKLEKGDQKVFYYATTLRKRKK